MGAHCTGSETRTSRGSSGAQSTRGSAFRRVAAYPRRGYGWRVLIRYVEIAVLARKQLAKVPDHVATKLNLWIEAVHADGLEIVRKIPGYHDEPLKGRARGSAPSA